MPRPGMAGLTRTDRGGGAMVVVHGVVVPCRMRPHASGLRGCGPHLRSPAQPRWPCPPGKGGIASRVVANDWYLGPAGGCRSHTLPNVFLLHQPPIPLSPTACLLPSSACCQLHRRPSQLRGVLQWTTLAQADLEPRTLRATHKISGCDFGQN